MKQSAVLALESKEPIVIAIFLYFKMFLYLADISLRLSMWTCYFKWQILVTNILWQIFFFIIVPLYGVLQPSSSLCSSSFSFFKIATPSVVVPFKCSRGSHNIIFFLHLSLSPGLVSTLDCWKGTDLYSFIQEVLPYRKFSDMVVLAVLLFFVCYFSAALKGGTSIPLVSFSKHSSKNTNVHV